jgi:hypothetical protein
MNPRAAASLLLVLSAAVSASFAATAWNKDESKVPPYTLPDPLACVDGTKVRDAAAWRTKRRPELLDLFAREVYGRTPTINVGKIRSIVTSVDRAALGGKAVRKEVTISFTDQKDGPQIHLLIYQPPGEPGAHAPWPAVLGLNFYGNQSIAADPGIALSKNWMRTNAQNKIVDNRATEGTRGVHVKQWSVETLVARGYATATIYYGDICPDHNDGIPLGAAGAVFGTKNANDRAADEWGAIGMWAWGLSRALDYLETDREIDAKRVAVHGHSRLGKAALWAGAQDERFALVISNNSGAGGAALSKRIFGETVTVLNTSFPHWFSKNFRRYNDNETALPIDQHELIALMAPRPVYVASASEDHWADQRGEFLSAKHAGPVYALFGKKGLGAADMPAVDHPVVGDVLGYHNRAGKHDVTPYDWVQYLDFADRVMKKK